MKQECLLRWPPLFYWVFCLDRDLLLSIGKRVFFDLVDFLLQALCWEGLAGERSLSMPYDGLSKSAPPPGPVSAAMIPTNPFNLRYWGAQERCEDHSGSLQWIHCARFPLHCHRQELLPGLVVGNSSTTKLTRPKHFLYFVHLSTFVTVAFQLQLSFLCNFILLWILLLGTPSFDLPINVVKLLLFANSFSYSSSSSPTLPLLSLLPVRCRWKPLDETS